MADVLTRAALLAAGFALGVIAAWWWLDRAFGGSGLRVEWRR